MKILQGFFSPHGGGTVDLMYKLSRALAQRGHGVAIYTGDFELDQEYIDSLPDVKVHLFHSWLNLSRVHLMPSIVMEVQRKLKEVEECKIKRRVYRKAKGGTNTLVDEMGRSRR